VGCSGYLSIWLFFVGVAAVSEHLELHLNRTYYVQMGHLREVYGDFEGFSAAASRAKAERTEKKGAMSL
jgi:hypothetical protein